MSSYVDIYGFRKDNGELKGMMELADKLRELKIPPPKELCDYFGIEEGVIEIPPQMKGDKVELPYTVGSYNSTQYYEIDLTLIPKDLRYIRFSESW